MCVYRLLPSSHGERVVMRLLDKQAGRLNMTYLGLLKPDYERLTHFGASTTRDYFGHRADRFR